MKISIEEAILLLQNGEVVAVPTETVYGLAACFQNSKAVEKIYELKNRPPQKPLSLLFSKFEQAQSLVKAWPDQMQKFKKFMPGSLTVVLAADTKKIPNIVRANSDSVGLRMPDQKQTLKIIDAVGPLAAPSANLSGEAPALTASEVEMIFGKEFPVVDGGECLQKEASTVIKVLEQGFEVLREGALPSQILKDL